MKPEQASAQNPLSEQSATLTRSEFVRRGLLGIGAAAMLPAMATQTTAQAQTQPALSYGPVKTYDMREFVKWVIDDFEPSVRLAGGAGRYVRKPGDTQHELYGTSDMACVLYTLGRLKPTEAERAEWAAAFQTFQNPDTGMLVEKAAPTHVPLHNTAFALGAMQLLDLSPKFPLKLGAEYPDPKAFLATLDWKKAVYPDSHKGAGIGAVFVLANLGDKKWFDGYFEFCDSMFDAKNGMMGQGKPAGGDFDQIGGTFHYAFLYSHFNRRMPYPERRIDSIIGLQRPDGHWDATNRTWLTLDGIYMLTRAARYCSYRLEDISQAIQRSLDGLMREMYSPDARKTAFGGRLPVHSMTCAVSALAEAQQFFGADKIITDWPLRMILDRRPFI